MPGRKWRLSFYSAFKIFWSAGRMVSATIRFPEALG
jgi:hypothetical protein